MKTDDFARLVQFDCASFAPPNSTVSSVAQNVILMAFYCPFKAPQEATKLIESYFSSYDNIDRFVFLTPEFTVESTYNFISHYFFYNSFDKLNNLISAYEKCVFHHTNAFVFGLTDEKNVRHRAINYFNILTTNWKVEIRKKLYAKK